VAGVAALTLLGAVCLSGTPVQKVASPGTTIAPPTTIATVEQPITDPTTTTPQPVAHAASTPAGAAYYCQPSTFSPASMVTQLATPNRPNLAYSASPGGPTAGHLQAPWGGPATRPVVNQTNGWLQIALNSRPNGSTAWVPSGDVQLTSTPYRIVISICQRTLTLYQGSNQVYASPVGVGRPQWPTPLGETFVDAIVNTPQRQRYVYGPTVLVLGIHSNVFTEFDGGNGSVGIHAYPSDPASTRGIASSHGCVRVSPQTIGALVAVPVGTPVDVIL
jgi:lipoprotein-anchoring transpeptidase ErfK/SrfK